MVEETFKSNGFYLYIAELEINKDRFAVEITRLRNLKKQYEDRNSSAANAREACPSLFDLIETENVLGPVRKQLLTPKIKQILDRFPNSKVKDYPNLYEIFEKNRKIIPTTRPGIAR